MFFGEGTCPLGGEGNFRLYAWLPSKVVCASSVLPAYTVVVYPVVRPPPLLYAPAGITHANYLRQLFLRSTSSNVS